jgi:hypothetical protein
MNIETVELDKLVTIKLKYLKTINNIINEKKKCYTSLLTDGSELISITQWNKNIFLNIEQNTTIELSNVIFKLVTKKVYALSLNSRDLELNVNSSSLIKNSDILISNINNMNVSDLIEEYRRSDRNKIISINVIATQIASKIIKDKTIITCKFVDSINLKHVILGEFWLETKLEENKIYVLNYITFKKKHDCKLVVNQYSEIIAIDTNRIQLNPVEFLYVHDFVLNFITIDTFESANQHEHNTNVSIVCLLEDVTYETNYLNFKLRDSTGISKYSNCWIIDSLNTELKGYLNKMSI